ncbi:hypothetical protein PoB_000723600 [Plakobranchus ocellatus]|uniref:Uncharacterized protein n=1 Tax=Plakobranchus ocellatus TaxID=259542 RepID=A0AAV3YC16_9GAST|nr:hypothetical protein PoB_000723600 [Plakobranchus ocellatus]
MAPHFPLSNKGADVRPGCKTQRIAPTLRQDGSRSRLGVLSPKETRILQNMYCWPREMLPPVLARPESVGNSRPEHLPKGEFAVVTGN